MKKHFIIKVADNGTTYPSQRDASNAAKEKAIANPGRTVLVYQLAKAYAIDTSVAEEVTLED